MQIKKVIKGGYHTVLNIHLQPGESMDSHYATSDAVIIVLEGKADLIFEKEIVNLERESAYLIPGLKYHELKAVDTLKAFLVLGSAGSIKGLVTKKNEQ